MKRQGSVPTGACTLLFVLATGCEAPPPDRSHPSSDDPSTRTAAQQIRDGFIEADGTRLYFKTLGEGDPLVVLHGGPGFDHRQFLPYIWDLAAERQVILFDQRGTGFSSTAVDSASIAIDNFVDDIEAVRQAFDLDRMNLMGHSWGGALAMHYALRHPDHLRSLVLVSSSASYESFSDMRAAILERRPAVDTDSLVAISRSDTYLAREPEAIKRFWRVYFKVYFADPRMVEGLDLTFTDNTIAHSEAVAGLVLRSAGQFDLHDRLRSLSVPTLVLHGDSDPLPMRYAQRIHESLPDSRLVVLDRSGHWVFVDAMDQVVESVRHFLGSL